MAEALIDQAVLIVLASIFLTMIYVARRKQPSKGENGFLLVGGRVYALLGLVFIYVGGRAMLGQCLLASSSL
jgi:hypothetical protein